MMQDSETMVLRNPEMRDGEPMWRLAKACPPLEPNTCYAYVLFCTHFAETCLLAEDSEGPIGYVLGYRPPQKNDTLFVWQIGVSERGRGKRLGLEMLLHLARNTPGITHLEATVAPSNRASCALFERFAKEAGAPCAITPFFGADIFGAEGHEAEDLFRIGPF